MLSIIAFTVCPINTSFADEIIPNYNLLPYTEKELIQMYMNDPDFIEYYNMDPDAASAMLERIIESYIELYQMGYGMQNSSLEGSASINANDNMNFAWVNMYILMQKNDYYCGPASALMAIQAWGEYVNGSTINEKQDTLAGLMNTSSTNGTSMGNFVSIVNTFILWDTAVNYYNTYIGSSLSTYEFRQIVYYSLSNDRAPILLANTGGFDYYGGASFGHYVAIGNFNSVSGALTVYDPINNTSYYGMHTINYIQAYNAVHNYYNRHLIANWN